jgi:uncharacterized membrane protein YdcZ (DUF606 family)
MNRISCVAALAAAALAGGAHAAQYDFSGTLSADNAVVQVAFDVSTPVGNVKLWTDSYLDGANFDPIIQLWSLTSATTGNLLGQNDDYFVAITPAQTSGDSALTFASLVSGSYLLTIEAYPNSANSTHLEDGFALDGAAPGPVIGGSFYSAHLSVDGTGVTITPVPEPDSIALLALGLGVVGWAAARRRRAA